ncbi:uncharacterized protein LOC113284077 isoform X1 [Papaver somniferum]|uniref:uncharacterized protein LOC113284077 isoform X1 n=1 Tax=Papaver somniferum TaxID=3469 RepID=UPI000E701097|nr:uncharacterized protein LOC113284077 isoform X1 [Papaver somniferum]
MEFEEEMEYQQNGEQGEHFNSETTGVVVQREKKVQGDTTFASFIGKKKEEKEREMVDWDMKKERPCGKNQAKYSSVIGVFLKQSRRWNWENPWNLQDDNAKDWLWAELKDLFVVDECHKQGTLSIAGGIFKDKKGKWKRKHYKLTNTHAMNLKDKPNSLTDGQWKSLVKLWDSEAHQTLSKKNAISRSQQKTKHTMGRKNYSRCEAEMAQENGGNPPTDGDVFIKTHINKVSGKALDPFSQGYIAQLREQSGLDENGLDKDGNQHSISNEVYAYVLPTKRHKRIRAQRCHLQYWSNEDFEREKEEREEEFKRQMKERDAEWERRMEAKNDQYNVRQNQMMEYVRLCRPDLFTRLGLSGPSDHLFRTGEHHHRPWEKLSLPYLWSSAKDLGSSLAYQRSNFLDLRRVTGVGSSPADTGRRLSYLWSSAKDLWSILADPRSYFLDRRIRFTYPGTI